MKPNRGPRFHGWTVEPWSQTVAHSSTVQPWNRGTKPWPTVPRFNRGTVETNRGPRFHGSTVEPWNLTVAHGSTVQPWNRGAKPWATVPRSTVGTVGTVNRGTVETVNRTVSTVPRSRLESAHRRPSGKTCVQVDGEVPRSKMAVPSSWRWVHPSRAIITHGHLRIGLVVSATSMMFPKNLDL